MDIQTISGFVLSSMGLALMALFGFIERHEPRILLYMLVNPSGAIWARGVLNVAATLFAQRTALRAMGYRLGDEMGQRAELELKRDSSSPNAGLAQEQVLT